jgi:fatty acid desaturase
MKTEQEIKNEAERLGKTISPSLILLMIFSVSGYFVNLYLYQIKFYGFIAFSVFSMVTLYNIFGVMHDGVHGTVFPHNRKINDAISIALGVLINFHFKSWKPVHIVHHMNTNTKIDPEHLLSEDRRKRAVFGTIFIYSFARVFVAFPKKIRTLICSISTKRAKIFLYLFKKNPSQSRFYSITLCLVATSVVIFGWNSPILWWYVSTFVASIVIVPLTQWIPHSGNFDKKNIQENKFMVAQNYFLPLVAGRQHLTHHLYPTVQVTRLGKFTKSINWLIEEKRKESNGAKQGN